MAIGFEKMHQIQTETEKKSKKKSDFQSFHAIFAHLSKILVA